MTRAPFIPVLHVQKINCRYSSGTEAIVSIMRKSADGKSVRNLSTGYDDVFGFADLAMHGQAYVSSINNGSREWIAYEPRYQGVHQVELREAERMVKTLRKLQRMQNKARKAATLNVPTDMMLLFAKFAGAKQCVVTDYTVANGGRGDNWSECEVAFVPLSEGIRAYARFISECLAVARPTF